MITNIQYHIVTVDHMIAIYSIRVDVHTFPEQSI